MPDSEPAMKHRPVRFSMQVSIGNVLEIAAVICAVSIAWANLDSRVTALEAQRATDARLSVLETRVAQADRERAEIQRATDARLSRIEQKIDRLISGQGKQ